MTITVEKRELASRLDELLTLVRAGTEVIVEEQHAQSVKLVVVEVPDQTPRPFIFNMHPGAYIADDFADPLPDEYWSESQ